MKEIELSHEEGVEIRRRESRHDEPGHSGLTNFKNLSLFSIEYQNTAGCAVWPDSAAEDGDRLLSDTGIRRHRAVTMTKTPVGYDDGDGGAATNIPS
jgi:hypothetical protein